MDYVDAVAVLALSLQKVKSKYPLLVAVVKDVATEQVITFLGKFNCEIAVIDPLQYSSEVQEKWRHHPVINTASKIQIFGFVTWDKLVYIDADSFVIKNIDFLFDYCDGSMLYCQEDDRGMSGLFVFEPMKHFELKYYPTLMANMNLFDGELLGELWFHVRTSPAHQIPMKYFRDYHSTLQINSEMCAIHFCNLPKPWIDPNHSNFDNSYIASLYKMYLNQIQRMK